MGAHLHIRTDKSNFRRWKRIKTNDSATKDGLKAHNKEKPKFTVEKNIAELEDKQFY